MDAADRIMKSAALGIQGDACDGAYGNIKYETWKGDLFSVCGNHSNHITETIGELLLGKDHITAVTSFITLLRTSGFFCEMSQCSFLGRARRLDARHYSQTRSRFTGVARASQNSCLASLQSIREGISRVRVDQGKKEIYRGVGQVFILVEWQLECSRSLCPPYIA